MKKIIILKYGDGELANQLWNYISIYAYGLEKKTPVYNPSFYEYHSFFNLINNENIIVKFASKLFSNYTRRKGYPWKKVWRKIYRIYPFILELTKKSQVISSDSRSNTVIYLPPTKSNPSLAEKETLHEIFFDGWLFRNPIGLKNYRERIISAFCPRRNIVNKIIDITSTLRNKFNRVIGVHIRQGDYSTFKSGRYLISQKRVREILDEYMSKFKISAKKVVFLLTSDGKIDLEHFRGLNTYQSKENAVTDLFLLSATDTVIGSDSSFGNFASWYGNIPHIVMSSNPMDWEFYENKKEYFENKYCTLVQS